MERAERQRLGLFDPAEDHSRRPLADHLTDYAGHMAASGDTPEHVHKTRAKVSTLFAECEYVWPRDLDAAKVTRWLNERRSDDRVVDLPEGKESFTANEAGEVLGVSGKSVVRGVKRLGLDSSIVTGRRMLPRQTVLALAANTAKGMAPRPPTTTFGRFAASAGGW